MALDPQTYGQQAEQALQQQIDGGGLSPSAMSEEFAAIYNDYGLEGECGGVDIAAGGDKALLDPAFIADNTAATITQIANALCDYWESFVTPGEAVVLDVVVSVVPDASAQRAPMEQAITDYINAGDSRDGWLGWYEATEAVVNQIPFAVTEQNVSTGSTSVFTRYVA